MDWKIIIKDDNFASDEDMADWADEINWEELKIFYNQAMNILEKALNHPDFNKDDFYRNLPQSYIEMVESMIENLDDWDLHLLGEYYNLHGFKFLENRFINLRKRTEDYIKFISKERSMKFLETVAETFGVSLRPDYDEIFKEGASFLHRGLIFHLHKGGVKITILGIDIVIEICVVDEKNLPIGDFFASMLGLIVAKPEQLDVVNFGIQLGLIILSHRSYHWNQIKIISIFTPFEATNNENLRFWRTINYMKNDDHELAPDILREIENALEDCFGSTRGFF